MEFETIFGVLGNITSLIVFLLPARLIYNIQRSPEERSMAHANYRAFLLQYHAAIISCALWICYEQSFLAYSSLIGIILEIFYLNLFVQYTALFMDVLVNRAFAIFEILSVLYGFPHVAFAFDYPLRFSGSVCAAGSLVVFFMKMVYQTERSSVLESAAYFANGAVWTVYALILSDSYILIPNLVWGLLGLVQLVMHYISPQAQIAEEVATRAQIAGEVATYRIRFCDTVDLAQLVLYAMRHRTLEEFLGILNAPIDEEPELEMV